jgi:hypothetical protein
MNKFKLTLLTVASTFFAGSSFAGVIYTNLGPGYSYGGAYTAAGGTGVIQFGTTFTATNSGPLSQVLVPVGDDPLKILTFDLYSDNGAGQPGALLEEWSNIAVPQFTALVTLESVVDPLILAGDAYWFTATSQNIPANGINFGLQWADSPVLSGGGIWAPDGTGGWANEFNSPPNVENQAAIELDTPTPEPGSWALFGFGLATVLAKYRRRSSMR